MSPSFLDRGPSALRERRAADCTSRNTDRDSPQRAAYRRFRVTIGGWTGSDKHIDQETLDVLGAGDFLSRIYTRRQGGNRQSVCSSAIFQPRGQATPFILPSTACRAPAGSFESSQYVDLTDADGKPHRVGEYIIANGECGSSLSTGTRRMGAAWPMNTWRRSYMVADAIGMNRTDGALVRVITPIVPGEGVSAARARAEAFTAQLAPLLPRFIPD